MLQYALNMKKFLLTAGVLLGACKESGPKLDPIKLVPKVDLNRYMGTWYVIANIPNFFEKGLVASTETYTRSAETGKIDILFQGRKKTFDGEILSGNAALRNSDCKTHSALGLVCDE